MTLCISVRGFTLLLVSFVPLFAADHPASVPEIMAERSRTRLENVETQIIEKYTKPIILQKLQGCMAFCDFNDDGHGNKVQDNVACMASEGARMVLCLLPVDLQKKVLGISSDKTYTKLSKMPKYYAFEHYAFCSGTSVNYGFSKTVPFDTVLLCSIPQLQLFDHINTRHELSNVEKELVENLPVELLQEKWFSNTLFYNSAYKLDTGAMVHNLADFPFFADMSVWPNNQYGRWARKLSTAFLYWPSYSSTIPDLSECQLAITALTLGFDIPTIMFGGFNNGTVIVNMNKHTLCAAGAYVLGFATKYFYNGCKDLSIFQYQTKNMQSTWFPQRSAHSYMFGSPMFPSVSAPSSFKFLFESENPRQSRNVIAIASALGICVLHYLSCTTLNAKIFKLLMGGVFTGLSIAIPLKNEQIDPLPRKTTIREIWEKAHLKKNKQIAQSFCTLL